MTKTKLSEWVFLSAIILSMLFLYMARYSINDYKKATSGITEALPGDISYHIDYCTIQSRFILIQGWAGLPNGGINVVKNIYILDQKGQAHKLHSTTIKTPQIVEKKRNPAFSHAGFIASAKNDSGINATKKFVIELALNGKNNVVTYECK
ncbi:hypothetical protein AB6T85_11810 [Erwinia sp. ACCC 02193]|uniref:Uncharacterized protein n=1 Tax=Erwinia aeris TaxID=3239803 RepID=A0ABV4E8G7_9GAMM